LVLLNQNLTQNTQIYSYVKEDFGPMMWLMWDKVVCLSGIHFCPVCSLDASTQAAKRQSQFADFRQSELMNLAENRIVFNVHRLRYFQTDCSKSQESSMFFLCVHFEPMSEHLVFISHASSCNEVYIFLFSERLEKSVSMRMCATYCKSMMRHCWPSYGLYKMDVRPTCKIAKMS